MGYENGKIYKLVSPNTDKVYIGSTIRTLSSRFKGHLTNMDTSAKELGLPLAIILIEEYPCSCKKDLELRETYWIRNTPNTINKNMPRRSLKEYRTENKAKLKRKDKERYENNKEEINLKKRELRRKAREKRKANIEEVRRKDRERRIKENIEKSREYSRKSHNKHKEKRNKEKSRRGFYERSWGGDLRYYNNNLLKISLDLFD
jgi:hypothetical protein